jgi:alanyl-tRNA synthetase
MWFENFFVVADDFNSSLLHQILHKSFWYHHFMNNFAQKLDSIAQDLKVLEKDMSTSGTSLEDIEVKMNNLTTALEGGKKSWTGDEVRQTFIDFFVEKKGHTFWPSSPVVPVNDPTLLFANAGMNQYKPLFLGTATPGEEMSSLKRAVNSQKCIRAGGKHNDLDDVGKDVYHHTFFEMLGNWSFGDFFKEEAIAWCWELLVGVYGLDPERLYASYFKGDPEKGLVCDDEAREIWLKYLPAERVLGFDCTDNFWEMGATGPCGPCSEVHYDRIGNRDAAHLVNADVADVMEIWNLVFMQFNRESETVFKSLPHKHIDTGMGLERIASILQDKSSNYDTDIFVPIFDLIQQTCGCKPYTGKIGAEDTDLTDMAYRVVADHIRTVTFAITDGCVPSSDGRGYVIRRILRRAVRYGQEILHAPAGFFTKLVPQVVAMMETPFPGMAAKQGFVMGVVEDEEQSFVRTLDQGVKHFQKVVAQLTAEGKTMVSGKDAHLLFGSMGFPFDLTQLMAEEKGFTVDKDEFDQLMEKDRQISVIAHSAKKIVGTRNFSMAAEQTAWLSEQGVEGTDSSSKYVWHTSTPAEIKAVYMGLGSDGGDGGAGFSPEVVCSEDDTFGVILDATSYYYESGGQINDVGTLKVSSEAGEEFTLRVLDCKTYGPYVLHVCSGADAVGQAVRVGLKLTCHVDYENRSFVAPNHTMTHSLNYALRKVLLGDECEISAKGSVDQKGSLVDSDKLRFDFGWGTALSPEELKAVETMVNNVIQSELTVFAENVPLADAKTICSLRCVFGERYPDPVRVLSVGVDVKELISNPDNAEWYKYSVEFCGGTHLNNTKEVSDREKPLLLCSENFAILMTTVMVNYDIMSLN